MFWEVDWKAIFRLGLTPAKIIFGSKIQLKVEISQFWSKFFHHVLRNTLSYRYNIININYIEKIYEWQIRQFFFLTFIWLDLRLGQAKAIRNKKFNQYLFICLYICSTVRFSIIGRVDAIQPSQKMKVLRSS